MVLAHDLFEVVPEGPKEVRVRGEHVALEIEFDDRLHAIERQLTTAERRLRDISRVLG